VSVCQGLVDLADDEAGLVAGKGVRSLTHKQKDAFPMTSNWLMPSALADALHGQMETSLG
jgi:hypothetical protein